VAAAGTGAVVAGEAETAVRRLRAVVALGLLAALLIAPRLWFHNRFFGPLPPLDGLPATPPVFDWLVYAALILLLPLVGLMRRPRRLILLWCALFAARAAVDVSVWQPYFYQYAAMLLSFALSGGVERSDQRADAVLNVNCLIVAAVYFWSGLNKLNYRFLSAGLEAVPGLDQLLSPLAPWIAPSTFAPLTVAMPFVEMAIAIGLLSGRRPRRVAATAAIAMHVLILLSIGPLGRNHNPVVWPWNAAMIVFVAVLFLRPDEVVAGRVLWGRGSTLHRVGLVLFVVGPLLGFFGLWPPSLSFRLYSFRFYAADIYMTEALRDRLPPDARAQVEPVSVFFSLVPAGGGPATKVGPYAGGLNISDWSERELHAFIPAQLRAYEQVFAKLCALADVSTDALLLVVTPPDLLTGATRQSILPCARVGTAAP
jgi:uncharacterized membrane protein YphA (DoxX/SURF4 family)